MGEEHIHRAIADDLVGNPATWCFSEAGLSGLDHVAQSAEPSIGVLAGSPRSFIPRRGRERPSAAVHPAGEIVGLDGQPATTPTLATVSRTRLLAEFGLHSTRHSGSGSDLGMPKLDYVALAVNSLAEHADEPSSVPDAEVTI